MGAVGGEVEGYVALFIMLVYLCLYMGVYEEGREGYHGDGHHGWIRDIHRSLGIRSIRCILAQEFEFGDIETSQLIQPYFHQHPSTIHHPPSSKRNSPFILTVLL